MSIWTHYAFFWIGMLFTFTKFLNKYTIAFSLYHRIAFAFDNLPSCYVDVINHSMHLYLMCFDITRSSHLLFLLPFLFH
jgi:hypothetical protein